MLSQTKVPHRYHEQRTNYSADEHKKHKKVALEATISIDTSGNESIESHSHLETEPCGFPFD
jgi:hypothetical protein